MSTVAVEVLAVADGRKMTVSTAVLALVVLLVRAHAGIVAVFTLRTLAVLAARITLAGIRVVTPLVALGADPVAKFLIAALLEMSVFTAVVAVGASRVTKLVARSAKLGSANVISMTKGFATSAFDLGTEVELVSAFMTEATLGPASISRVMSSAKLATQALIMVEPSAYGTVRCLADLIGMPKRAALVAPDLRTKIELMTSLVAEATRVVNHDC